MDHSAHFFAIARYLAIDEPIETVSTLAVDLAGTHDKTIGEARQDSAFSISWRYANPAIDGLRARVSPPPKASEVFGERGII